MSDVQIVEGVLDKFLLEVEGYGYEVMPISMYDRATHQIRVRCSNGVFTMSPLEAKISPNNLRKLV